MNSTRRLAIITLLTIVGSLVLLTEARYHGDENPRHRHRHRHEVSSLTARRNHGAHRLSARKPSWSQDDSYDELAGDADEDKLEDDEEDDDEEDYYRPRHYQPRLEPQPYRGRYHANTRHESNFRHAEETERRRRFGTRGHRTRPWTYRDEYTSRNHDLDSEEVEDNVEDYDEYERPRWHHLDDEESSRWRSNYPTYRRSDSGYASSHRDWMESRREWRSRRTQLDRRRKTNYQREAKRWYPDDDYDYDADDELNTKSPGPLRPEVKPEDQGYRSKNKKSNVSEENVDEKDDDEDGERIWNEAGDDDTDESDGIDNDFFHDEPSHIKTHDDIIKRVTSNDPKTLKPSNVKRDYRNVDIEKYLKKDSYGNLKYEPKNVAKNGATVGSISDRGSRFGRKEFTNNNVRYLIAPNQKPSVFNPDSHKMIEEKKLISKILVPRAKIKNIEQEDEDYSEDRQSDVQSDVMTAEDAEDENATENETSAPITSFPIAPSSTQKTTTTTSTTPVPRPVITTQQAYDRRDSRLFGSTISSNNGVQSIYNSHKVQAKESRSQVQTSKNGKSAERREALQHAIKVSREGSCQLPRARVIPVKDVYPSPSTTYTPHCVILHRCSDDTGCCRSEALTCVSKQSQKVELYFYTTSIGAESVVEKLSFYNDTECECREKSEQGITTDKEPSSMQESEYRSYPNRQQHQSAMPPQNIRRPPQKKPCRCPSEFTPRITLSGECQCNCYEEDQDCIRVRRGKGYFSLRDRLCIQNDDCAVPACEFGAYIRRQGRCPRKKDKFNEIANYPNHSNFNHRHRS